MLLEDYTLLRTNIHKKCLHIQTNILLVNVGLVSQYLVICVFVTLKDCRCRNLNCRTVEYKYREKTLVVSKYCQTVNCQTIEVSDCEIRLYYITIKMVKFASVENLYC